MTGSFKVQLINMGTRAAAFQAKLRCLYEYHVRLLHNVQPAPSGIDIANTIKYFSQTLLTVLKDVRTSPHQLIKDPSEDPVRMSAYPNLEYGNLYNALTMLLEVATSIQYGHITFGKALLQCLCCILPFLDKDLIDNLPYLSSSTISVLPSVLHQDIINALCYYILPFTITRKSPDEQECQACQSVSSVIMMVFQYSNNPAHHCQLLECLMTLKHNVVKDILCVIAYGTAASRSSAAKLLFYYWPAFDPNLFDRRGLLSKLTNDLVPFVCQREQCPNAGNAEAAKVCYDHGISIMYASDCPPPLYLCIECANEIHREHPNLSFGDILHPMQQVSMVCENKNCRSSEKSAFSICFSTECASYNGNHPIRYCAQCHGNRHNSRRGGDHVVHRSLPPAWQMDAEMQMNMVESVVSLLREAKPLNFEPGRESGHLDSKNGHTNGLQDNISLDERQLLGRYGIWLLVGRCKPTQDTPIEILGRLLSMLFHWFHVTAYSYDSAGQVESTIEKLKTEHVCQWLQEICEIHYNIFISCLLPHPPEYARVGGHWETLASRTSHLKEGLQRLICLVPYEVITAEIWDYVMPHWMEAITNDVVEKELQELKIVLSKILDPEMSPLGFDAKTMYNFVAIRFEKTTAKVQQQALHWLQILTKLEILIPLPQLFAMFGDGVRIMKYGVQHEQLLKEKEKETKGQKVTQAKDVNKDRDLGVPPRRSSISPVVEDESGNTSAISDDEAPTNRHTEFSTDTEHNLTCCILMLDVLLMQMELQDIEQHMGMHTSVCENVSRLLKCMVTAAKVGLGTHTCSLKVSECAYCEASVMWHQLSTKLVQFMAPKNPIRPPDPPIEEIIEDEKSSRKSPPDSDKDKSRDRDMSLSMAPLPIPLGPLGGFAGVPFFPDDGKIIIMAGPVPVAVPQPEPHSVGGVLVHMPHVCSTNELGRSENIELQRNVHNTNEIMTATVETVSEQLDLAAIIPSEKIVSATAKTVTLSEADVASATVQVTKPQYLGISDSDKNDSFSDENCDDENEDGEDFWQTSVGKFKFTLDTLPQTLQYIHQLLTEIPTIQKPDILYYIIQCLNVMSLHGDALTKAARDQRGFFIWCQENLLIKNLWDLCNAEHSHICQVGIPLLLHCITLPLGSDVFWRVVQEAFHDSDWRIRFTAVERVTVITRFMDSTPLRTEVGLQTALATAFCHLIASMDDINVHVAQRATLYLGTIHDYAIRSLLFCLESQFDLFIVDRPVVLQSLYQLHNSLSDRRVLTWDFFLNRFDTLFVEAQINLEKTGDITYLRDLRNSENGSEILSSKIIKAREALSQSDTSTGLAKTLSASFGTKWPYKRTMSAPASMAPRQESKLEKEKIYSRQISAPILKRKTSRFGLDGHFHSIGGAGDENIAGLIHRIMELEESDRETIHLLVFLLMQFMSRTDQAYPSEEKYIARTQNIVLKHIFLLLGHSQMDKTFHTTPSKLRVSAVFNAFLANLPQVMDQNHLIGGLILPSVLQILLFAPCPINNGIDTYQNLVFNYSLWYLEPHARRNWLMSILVVLYKYTYTQPPYTSYVNNAVRIIINSLKAQFHQCKRIPTTTILDLPTARSREVSQPSLGTDPDEKGQESPPVSPMFPSEGTSGASKSKCQVVGFTQKSQHPSFRKYHDSSLEADDTESELVAIPESDFSDSTLHGSSAPGSFDDPQHFDEVSAPYKSDTFKNRLHAAILGPVRASSVFDDQFDTIKKIQKTTTTTTTTTTTSVTSKKDDNILQKSICKSTEYTSTITTQKRCSLQEGVRMMVTPSMLVTDDVREKAILNPPVEIQRAITITQNNKLAKTAPETMSATSKMFANIATNHFKAIGVLPGLDAKQFSEITSIPDVIPKNIRKISNGGTVVNQMDNTSPPHPVKPLGRHKKIIDATPTGTPITTSSSSNTDDSKSNGKPTPRKALKNIEKSYASPESPLSRMSVLPTPGDEIDGIPTAKQIAQLEIPTPERLLPIGPQEGITQIVERVREVLKIPDISHLKQDSLEKSESTKDDVSQSTRGNSPRRLIKQDALDSPPHLNSDDVHSRILKSVTRDTKTDKLFIRDDVQRQRPKLKKVGPFAVDSQSIPDIRTKYAGSWAPNIHRDDSDYDEDEPNGGGDTQSKQENRPSLLRVGDYSVCARCAECGAMIEEYNDEEIGILIISLGTFIHREATLAAPFLPEILAIVSKFAMHHTFPWQNENATHLPGGSQSVAHQFIRCVLHQLAPNGIFVQLFQTEVSLQSRKKYFKSIAQALLDFPELNPTSPIYMVCESLTSKKTLPLDILPVIFRNMAEYFHCIPSDSGLGAQAWTPAMQALESLFRQVVIVLSNIENAEYLLDVIVATLKIPGLPKVILEPYSKVVCFCVQNAILNHKVIYDMCTLSIRAFSKDRDKMLLCRQLIFELVQSLKFKTTIPDHNLLLIVGFALQDAGGALPPNVIEGLPDTAPLYTTNAADCMRQYMNDILDFLADFHTLNKIKNFKNGQSSNGLGEDTLGGVLKGAVAQYLALEMSRGNTRDNKVVSRYLPWLYNAPSSLQQGPKEFTECVGHMRLLSWLLMGSLTHTALMQRRSGVIGQHGASVHYQFQHPGQTMTQPVPQEASCHIADHIQVIFAGFAEQSKASVLHMSSLFHAFTLCQLWTVYLEQLSNTTASSSEGHNITMGILFEFWAKVTPCILQLVTHSTSPAKEPTEFHSTHSKLSEMVNLHFLSLLEALKETRSTILGKLLPLWSPVLSSQSQLSDTLHMRLQSVRDYAPDFDDQNVHHSEALLKWLQRLQFKMGQIELQSSTATQFYSI